jgi:hypothetical protein
MILCSRAILTEQAIRDEVRRINAEAIRLNELAAEHHERCLGYQKQVRSYEAQYNALRTLLRECHGKDFGNTAPFPFAEQAGDVPF